MKVEDAITTLRVNGYSIEWCAEGGVESIAVKAVNPKLSAAAAGVILGQLKEMKPAALDFLRAEAAPKLMCALAANAAGTEPMNEMDEVVTIAKLNIALGRTVTSDGYPWLEVLRGYEEAQALAAMPLKKAA